MTIPYAWKIATNSPKSFLRLLFRWKGSVYRYVIFDFAVFIFTYMVISIGYRHFMSETMKRHFEYCCIYCKRVIHLIPMSLVIGFYVDVVVKRWWAQFLLLPWPYDLAMLLSAYTTTGAASTAYTASVKSRLKAVVRYANLTYILLMRRLNSRVANQFPVDQTLLAIGVVTPDELRRLKSSVPKGRPLWYSTPSFWATNLVCELHAEGAIPSNLGVECILKELRNFRGRIASISLFYIVNVPLGFTQVATVTMYGFGLSSLFAWQFLDPSQNYPKSKVDLYLPIFGLLRLGFNLGWLKVAEALINPFGDDADDLEIPDYITQNLQVSDFIIEKMHDEAPPLTHGVLLDMVQNGAAPPSHPDTGASDTPTLAAPTCRKFSLLCGNEFVGSFGPTQHHPPPQQHRYHRFASPSSQPAVDSAVDQRPVYREHFPLTEHIPSQPKMSV